MLQFLAAIFLPPKKSCSFIQTSKKFQLLQKWTNPEQISEREKIFFCSKLITFRSFRLKKKPPEEPTLSSSADVVCMQNGAAKGRSCSWSDAAIISEPTYNITRGLRTIFRGSAFLPAFVVEGLYRKFALFRKRVIIFTKLNID